jgi:hypothetical protein
MADGRALLLAAIRLEAEAEKIARLRGFSEEEWEALLEEAGRHGLVPLLFHSLKTYYPDPQIPPQIQERLRSIYYSSAARNMKLYQQLEGVVRKFARENIQVILLKGAHLAMFVYDNMALRPMVDIDLLLKPLDLEKVHKILIMDGYSTATEKISLDPEIKHLPPYWKRGGISGFLLEVHVNITSPPIMEQSDMNALWARVEKASIGEAEVFILSPEDLFLHLCLHSCIQHNFENGLIACIDAANIIKYYGERIKWQQLWEQAQWLGIERALYLILALTEKLVGVPVPEEISQVVNLNLEAQNALEEAEDLIFEQYTGISENIASLFAKRGWRGKAHIFSQRLFLSKKNADGGDAGQNKEAIIDLKRFRTILARFRTLLKAHHKTFWLGLRRDPQTESRIEIQRRRNSLREWLTHAEE